MNCPMNVVFYAQIAFKKLMRLDQPMRKRSSNALMTVHAQLLVQPQVSMGTGASNGRCSDAMTLPINDWLFHLVFGCVHCIRHVFSLTHPQLGNLGLKENLEFPTCNNDFVVAFMCVQLVNTIYPT